MTVDEALEFAERARAPELSFNEYEFQAMHALADEVLRLREANRVTAENFGKAQLEIAQLRTDDWKLRQDLKTACENAVEFQVTANALRAKLARVEALPARWRNDAGRSNDPRSPTHLVDCADDVEEALRDDPQHADAGDDK